VKCEAYFTGTKQTKQTRETRKAFPISNGEISQNDELGLPHTKVKNFHHLRQKRIDPVAGVLVKLIWIKQDQEKKG